MVNKHNDAPAKKSEETGEPPHPFKTGYDFTPTEIVTDRKLGDQVDEMKVDYPALAQLLGNSGASLPDALIRFRRNMLQLRNGDTGKWHAIWLGGNPGEESIRIGPGED